MTDIVFPPGLLPSRVTWTLERAAATFESPLSFASQRVNRSGARWRASIEMPPSDQFESGLLSAWLDQISRADNCGLLPVFQNRLAGNSGGASFSELQVPWDLRNPSLDWSILNLQGAALFVANRDLSVYSTTGVSVSNQARAFRTFTVTANAPYLVTVDIPPQHTGGGYAIGDTITNLVDARVPPPGFGRFRHVVYPTTTSLEIYLTPTNGQQSFTNSRFSSLSVCRTFVAQTGVAAGGSTVTLTGNTNTGNPAQALSHGVGQFLAIQTSAGWELKRLTTDVHTIGGGSLAGLGVGHLGRATFEPPLRGAVTALAPIEQLLPVCRMRLAEPNSSSTIDAPMFGGFSFDLLEWFGA